jgi:polyhydroxyalkanoate synthesis regulator phasin|tara:strand:- start:133 stop:447 length:315 start_codon:yes stop_codon:yes gene_type:complete
MNEELMLGIGVVVFVVGFGLKHYRKLRTAVEEALEDGQLTLDEAFEIVEDIQESVEEVKSLPSASALKRMKKDDLAAMCVEYGIDEEGTKALLIERLQEMKNNG